VEVNTVANSFQFSGLTFHINSWQRWKISYKNLHLYWEYFCSNIFIYLL